MSGKFDAEPSEKIPPVRDDRGPEVSTGAIDQTRGAMATYSLPQLALQFDHGSSRGSTDPLRYSRPGLSPPDRSPAGEPSWMIRRGQLPGVHQILAAPRRSDLEPAQAARRHYHAPLSPPSLGPTRGPTAEPPRTDTVFASPNESHPSTVGTYQHVSRSPPHPREQVQGAAPPPRMYSPVSHPGANHHRPDPGPPSQPAHLLQSDPSQPASPVYPMHSSQKHATTHHIYPNVQPPAYSPTRPVHPEERSRDYESPPKKETSSPHHRHRPPLQHPDQQGHQHQEAKPPLKLQPRVISEEVLPGGSHVYVYEDGSTIPKEIDGEPVNAQWGVTKAGKPRKRLAVACTTCREKKIKCDPAEPKCAQCEKFGRDCHYSSAPRNQRPFLPSPSRETHASSSSASLKAEDPKRSILPSSSRSSKHQDPAFFKRRNSSPDTHRDPTFDKVPTRDRERSPPHKKRRSQLPAISETERRYYAPIQEQAEDRSPERRPSDFTEDEDQREDSTVQYDWSVDPRQVNATLTAHFLDMFFIHVNAATHHLLPRQLFMQWLERNPETTEDDRMILYAMLALGALFSLQSDRKAYSDAFVRIASRGYQRDRKKCCIQLAQTRILLALHNLATGDLPSASDFVGSAIQAVVSLNLNVEEECTAISEPGLSAYGLTEDAMAECRRRTFWSAYILDRFCGVWCGRLSMIQSEDALLRLPCDEDCYLQQKESKAPFFDNGFVDSKLCHASDSVELGPMAYLVQIISIWGDMTSYNPRRSCQEAEQYSYDYEIFYTKMMQRLHTWSTQLPSELVSTPANAALSIKNGTAGHFINIHAIYHATAIRLNRYFYHGRVSSSTSSRNIKKARRHAQELLQMLHIVHEADQSATPSRSVSAHPPQLIPFPYAGSIPFVSHAAMLAVDVLSAGGRIDRTLFDSQISSMSTVLTLVDEVSRCWSTAETQKQSIAGRIEALNETVMSEAARRKKAWRCRQPLDPASRPEQDVFYPTRSKRSGDRDTSSDHVDSAFFEHMDIKIKSDEILTVG